MRPDTITLPQDLTTFIGHRKVMRDLLKTRCYAELDAALEALNLLHLSKNQRYWDYGLCLNSDFLFELPLQYVHERIAILDDWRNVTPSSYHQALYRAQLWDEVASTIRGTGWADDVSNAEWVGSALARDASMIAALQAIELHDRPLFAYRSLMTLSARFGEPAWLLKLAADEPPADYEQICTDYDRQDWEEGLALFGSLGGSLPTLPNALPTCLPPRKEHEFNVGKTYWLLRGLEAHPADLDLLNDYVCFLYPRWGGT